MPVALDHGGETVRVCVVGVRVLTRAPAPLLPRDMFGERATAMVERLQRATWLPPYDDTMREVLTEIDELHAKANDWLQ